MPNVREIYLSLYGAWRLLHLDRAGLGWFDASLGGFWKSFFAAAIVLPAFIVVELALPVPLPEDSAAAGMGRKAAANAIVYVFAWIVYPLLMVSVTDLMGRGDKYFGYIVAYNWAGVLQSYIVLPAILLTYASEAVGVPILLIVQLAMYGFGWFIARVALDISALAAVGLVFVDIVLAVLLSQLRFYLLT
ncbi:MAG: hypothetical protein O7A03_06530 [Alphaproteobacteria bacterium]|nr:hypothetical protein [Alphaproteobacteria bacterium]